MTPGPTGWGDTVPPPRLNLAGRLASCTGVEQPNGTYGVHDLAIEGSGTRLYLSCRRCGAAFVAEAL